MRYRVLSLLLPRPSSRPSHRYLVCTLCVFFLVQRSGSCLIFLCKQLNVCQQMVTGALLFWRQSQDWERPCTVLLYACLMATWGGQEQNMSGGGFQAGFHMPSSADLLVTKFYGWLLRSAGGGPSWPPGTPPLPPPVTNREALLSRKHQHVSNCPSCQTMLAVNGHTQLAAKVSTWVLSSRAYGWVLSLRASHACTAHATALKVFLKSCHHMITLFRVPLTTASAAAAAGWDCVGNACSCSQHCNWRPLVRMYSSFGTGCHVLEKEPPIS